MSSAAPRVEHGRDPQQCLGALGGGPGSPVLRRAAYPVDGLIQQRRILDPGAAHDPLPGRGERDPGEDLPRPFPVRGQRGVAVGGVAEAGGTGGDRGLVLAAGEHRGLEVRVVAVHQARDAEHRLRERAVRGVRIRRARVRFVHGREPVLPAPRAGRQAGIGGALQRDREAADLPLQQVVVVVQPERGRQEVLTGRVLLEPPHEVADRDVELVRLHHGDVEQHVPDLAAHRLDLPLRHAEQHLELDRGCGR